ncbi:hypothetical protein BIW11_11563, partial [Tropilaelaps mercedesae]
NNPPPPPAPESPPKRSSSLTHRRQRQQQQERMQRRATGQMVDDRVGDLLGAAGVSAATSSGGGVGVPEGPEDDEISSNSIEESGTSRGGSSEGADRTGADDVGAGATPEDEFHPPPPPLPPKQKNTHKPLERSNASNPGGDEGPSLAATVIAVTGGSCGVSSVGYALEGTSNGIALERVGATPLVTSCDSSSSSSSSSSTDDGVLEAQPGLDNEGPEEEMDTNRGRPGDVVGTLAGNVAHLSLEHCSFPPLPTVPQEDRRPSSGSVGSNHTGCGSNPEDPLYSGSCRDQAEMSAASCLMGVNPVVSCELSCSPSTGLMQGIGNFHEFDSTTGDSLVSANSLTPLGSAAPQSLHGPTQQNN